MNNNIPSAEIQKALKAAAENFEPSRRFKPLQYFKEPIQMLRKRGASFRIIADILKKHNVQTCEESVRLFYWQIVRRQQRKGKRRAGQSQNAAASAKRPLPKRLASNFARSTSEIGPRIANVDEL